VTPLRLAVLGDSIGFGQGAAQPDETPGQRLVAALADAGQPAELRVFAVPGARSASLGTQVTRAARWSHDVAVIVVGANDLTHFVPPETAAEQLGEAVRGLRAAQAEVVVAPAPDLSVVPWVPPRMRPVVRAASAALRAAQIRAALAAGARVADADSRTTAAFAADATLFSADRFHPSSAGYAVIAEALRAPVLAAALERRGERPAGPAV